MDIQASARTIAALTRQQNEPAPQIVEAQDPLQACDPWARSSKYQRAVAQPPTAEQVEQIVDQVKQKINEDKDFDMEYAGEERMTAMENRLNQLEAQVAQNQAQQSQQNAQMSNQINLVQRQVETQSKQLQHHIDSSLREQLSQIEQLLERSTNPMNDSKG